MPRNSNLTIVVILASTLALFGGTKGGFSKLKAHRIMRMIVANCEMCMSPADLRKRAQDTLASDPQILIETIDWYATSISRALSEAYGKPVTDITFSAWRSLYLAGGSTRWAQFIRLGRRSGLRYIDGKGGIHTEDLRGGNLFSSVINSVEVKLLDLRISPFVKKQKLPVTVHLLVPERLSQVSLSQICSTSWRISGVQDSQFSVSSALMKPDPI